MVVYFNSSIDKRGQIRIKYVRELLMAYLFSLFIHLSTEYLCFVNQLQTKQKSFDMHWVNGGNNLFSIEKSTTLRIPNCFMF